MQKLRLHPDFTEGEFNHFRITLHCNGEYKFEYADIPRNKNEPGVYMTEGTKEFFEMKKEFMRQDAEYERKIKKRTEKKSD